MPPDRSDEIVPRISEFANTQNKVNEADFSSNHPFHVAMQDFSRSVIFTAREGERHDSKWFYERSRGQYINDRPKIRGASQSKFDIEYPKPQLFAKTDLAKFEFSATGQPHWVSRGAQKNFAEFAKAIREAWSKSSGTYGDLWYRRLISKAIVFRWLETQVPKQAWYEGGYRANIVTYAMAKVFHDANGDKQVLDLDTIWRRQSVPEALQHALLLAAAEAHDVITHPPTGVRNMSEWAKQQACWNGMKGRILNYDEDFESCLTLVETVRTDKRDEKAKKAIEDGINAQSEVVTFGADFWKEVLAWGRDRKRLTPKDQQILEVCVSMPRRVPSDLQSRHALDVLGRMRDLGFGDE